MSQSDALLMRAVRVAADSLNDALQVILLEVGFLVQYGHLVGAEAAHLARLTAAAHKAARLSHIIFGTTELAEAGKGETCDETADKPAAD